MPGMERNEEKGRRGGRQVVGRWQVPQDHVLHNVCLNR